MSIQYMPIRGLEQMDGRTLKISEVIHNTWPIFVVGHKKCTTASTDWFELGILLGNEKFDKVLRGKMLHLQVIIIWG